MAVSLEARVPLLDHHLVEFAWQLPMHMKVRDGRGKWLLRTLLHEYVPAALVERPKQGFTVPVEHWLRRELRDWAQDLLSPAALARHGLLDARVVGTYLREHLDGRRAWTPQLWSVLMFQAWHAALQTPEHAAQD
jgi:asparagine synthase (glutamine-hydrolysing)